MGWKSILDLRQQHDNSFAFAFVVAEPIFESVKGYLNEMRDYDLLRENLG